LLWALENIQTVVQVDAEIMNISCAKLVIEPHEFFAGLLKLLFEKYVLSLNYSQTCLV
jgi:hypothetical protein